MPTFQATTFCDSWSVYWDWLGFFLRGGGGDMGEDIFIFMELGITGNYFKVAGEQAHTLEF